MWGKVLIQESVYTEVRGMREKLCPGSREAFWQRTLSKYKVRVFSSGKFVGFFLRIFCMVKSIRVLVTHVRACFQQRWFSGWYLRKPSFHNPLISWPALQVLF